MEARNKERDRRLIITLSKKTVANGCTREEEESAKQMILKIKEKYKNEDHKSNINNDIHEEKRSKEEEWKKSIERELYRQDKAKNKKRSNDVFRFISGQSCNRLDLEFKREAVIRLSSFSIANNKDGIRLYFCRNYNTVFLMNVNNAYDEPTLIHKDALTLNELKKNGFKTMDILKHSIYFYLVVLENSIICKLLGIK